MKKQKEQKDARLKKMKTKLAEEEEMTEEKLKGLMEQIAALTGQVQKEMTRKQEEKKQFEESVLLQQETMSQNDQNLS